MLVPIALVDGVLLTTAANPLFTADVTTIITKGSFCNNHTSAVTLIINVVPLAGTAGAGNQLTKVKSLQAGESWDCPQLAGHVVGLGGFISITPSVDSKIGCRISGSKVS